MLFPSCQSVGASPPIKKVGLTLDWDKMHSQNVSLSSINLCVQILFSRVLGDLVPLSPAEVAL